MFGEFNIFLPGWTHYLILCRCVSLVFFFLACHLFLVQLRNNKRFLTESWVVPGFCTKPLRPIEKLKEGHNGQVKGGGSQFRWSVEGLWCLGPYILNENYFSTEIYMYYFLFFSQLAGFGCRWDCGVYWCEWRRDSDGSHDPWWAVGERPGVLFNLYSLWNPPRYDLGSVCLHHSIPWSQPGVFSYTLISYTLISYTLLF